MAGRRGCIILTRPAPSPLPGHNDSVHEDFTAPYTPRLTPRDRTIQAFLFDRA